MKCDVNKLCERICMFGIKLEQSNAKEKHKHKVAESSIAQEYNELREEVGRLKPESFPSTAGPEYTGIASGGVFLGTLLAWTYHLRDFLYANFGVENLLNELTGNKEKLQPLLTQSQAERAYRAASPVPLRDEEIEALLQAARPDVLREPSFDTDAPPIDEDSPVARVMKQKLQQLGDEGLVDDLKGKVDALKSIKDEFIKKAEYVQAARIRDQIDIIERSLLRERQLPDERQAPGSVPIQPTSGQVFVNAFWREQTEKALILLSGDLNHDNVARAKEVLKKTLDLSSDKTLESEVKNGT